MATVIPLRTQKEIQGAFDKASELGVQHYHWIPPEWQVIHAAKFQLESNAVDPDGMFKPYPGYDSVAEFVNTRSAVAAESDEMADPGPPAERKKWKWPTSSADTSHVDPIKSSGNGGETFSDDELEKSESQLRGHGHQKQANYLAELRRVIGPNSIGMKRLDLLFEWVILRATVLLNDINRALELGASAQAAYNSARDNYLKFLRDLDDHEPALKQGRLDPTPGNKAGKSGYGRSIKWSYIAPIIHDGRITAARVIVHWNPHSSSLGVPIKH